jgi:hypothetical protein
VHAADTGGLALRHARDRRRDRRGYAAGTASGTAFHRWLPPTGLPGDGPGLGDWSLGRSLNAREANPPDSRALTVSGTRPSQGRTPGCVRERALRVGRPVGKGRPGGVARVLLLPARRRRRAQPC